MKNIVILILVLIFFGCTSEVKENDSSGFVTVSISSKVNNLLFFKFSMGKLSLIDEAGNHTQLSGSGSYPINFSTLENRGEIIMKVEVPSGVYTHISVGVDLTSAMIKTIRNSNVETPDIYDSYGVKVTENGVVYNIESDIDRGIPLVVLPGETTHLSLQVDVDASTRILASAEEEKSKWLVSPVFYVSSRLPFSDSMSISGEIISLDHNKMALMPLRASNAKQAFFSVNLDASTVFRIDGERVSLEQFNKRVNLEKRGIADLTLSIDDEVKAKVVDYTQGQVVYKLQGFINKDNKFLGSRETLSKALIKQEFIKAPVKNVDSRDTPLYVTAYTHQENLDFTTFNVKTMGITGYVTQNDAKESILSPLSLQSIESTLLFEENDSITLVDTNDTTYSDELMRISGQFSNRVFELNEAYVIDDRKKRLFLALPLSSDLSVADYKESEGLMLIDNKSEVLYYLSLLNFSVIPKNIEEIKSIQLASLPENISVSIERVTPYHESYSFLTEKEFYNFLKKKKSAGYSINSLVADGYVEGNKFIASNLLLSMFKILPASLGGLLSLLYGPKYEQNKYQMHSTGFLSLIKNIDKYTNGNIDRINNPIGRSEVERVGGKLKRKYKKPTSKQAYKLAKSNEVFRRISGINSGTGGYLSQILNETLKKVSFDEGNGVAITMSKQLEKISPLMSLSIKTDPVIDSKVRIQLEDYVAAIKSSDHAKMEKSIFYAYFKNDDNKLFLESVSDIPFDKKNSNFNDLILNSDETGVLKKLLLTNTDLYKKIYTSFESYAVNEVYNSDSLRDKQRIVSDKDDKGQFYDKLKSMYSADSGDKLTSDFKKITRVITETIEKQRYVGDSPLDESQQRKLLSSIQQSFEAEENSPFKKYTSALNSNTGDNTTTEVNNFSPEKTISVKNSAENTRRWSVEVQGTINAKPMTLLELSKSGGARKPFVRARN